jgi:hypothetical protein
MEMKKSHSATPVSHSTCGNGREGHHLGENKTNKMLPFQIQMGETAKKTSPNHPPKSPKEKKQTHTTHLTNLFISQLPQTAKNNTYSKTCHPTNNRFIAK